MKNLIAYKTDIQLTANIIETLSNSINKYIKGSTSKTLHINEFLKNGIPDNVDGIITLGILRGTGHLLKDAARKNIDRYYIDHAYFEPGYEGDCWLRISKNKHTVNYIKQVSSFRWEKFFSKKYKILPWKNFHERGKNILLIPPTNAISWYFRESSWENKILTDLENYLPKETLKSIKVREKPNEPMVDHKGNYLGIRQNKTKDSVSLEEELSNASIVIAYNSQVALEATLRGIPVIVNKHNCCFGLSFKLSDLKQGIQNNIFDEEPDRLSLCKWLSYCQFTFEEIKNGFAWKTINNFQN